MQIFIEMEILMLEKYFILENDKRMCQGRFSHPVEVTGLMYLSKYFLNYVYLKDLYKTLKEIEVTKLHRSLG